MKGRLPELLLLLQVSLEGGWLSVAGLECRSGRQGHVKIRGELPLTRWDTCREGWWQA